MTDTGGGNWEFVLGLVLRPVVALLFFAAVVIPIELALQRIWPDGRLKMLLFDRTFQKRRPWAFFAAWLLCVGTVVGLVSLYCNIRSSRLG